MSGFPLAFQLEAGLALMWDPMSDLRSAVHSELGWAVRSVDTTGSLWAEAWALCWVLRKVALWG